MWKSLAEFPDYEISINGEVRRTVQRGRRYKAGYVLTPKKHQRGYHVYTLVNADGVSVTMLAHRLVALAHLGPAPSLNHEVAHNDGSRTNNHVSNLRWSTAKDNQADRKKHGTFMHGDNSPSSKLTSQDVEHIRSEYAASGQKYRGGGVTYRDLSARFGVSQSQISRIVNGAHWN